jgi:hypothetical protein
VDEPLRLLQFIYLRVVYKQTSLMKFLLEESLWNHLGSYWATRAGESCLLIAYSTTSSSFVLHSRTPLLGFSCVRFYRDQGLQIESELVHVFRGESPSLKFKGYKALKVPMVEKQIKFEVLIPTWTRTFSPTKAKPSPSSIRNFHSSGGDPIGGPPHYVFRADRGRPAYSCV